VITSIATSRPAASDSCAAFAVARSSSGTGSGAGSVDDALTTHSTLSVMACRLAPLSQQNRRRLSSKEIFGNATRSFRCRPFLNFIFIFRRLARCLPSRVSSVACDCLEAEEREMQRTILVAIIFLGMTTAHPQIAAQVNGQTTASGSTAVGSDPGEGPDTSTQSASTTAAAPSTLSTICPPPIPSTDGGSANITEIDGFSPSGC
jgi:hypothetical protein